MTNWILYFFMGFVVPDREYLMSTPTMMVLTACFFLGIYSLAHPDNHGATVALSPVLVPRRNFGTRKATSWRISSTALSDDSKPTTQRRVVVIGGGWAGFSAADALSYASNGTVQVDLLDASPRGLGGLAGGWKSRKVNATVEAGLHGFWREYRNTIATVERIVTETNRRRRDARPLSLDDILTPYTPSVLYSASGRVALAPVLGNDDASVTATSGLTMENSWDMFKVLTASTNSNATAMLQTLAQLLPPPLDVAIRSEFAPGSPLTPLNRVSAARLWPIWGDFDPADRTSWERYDSVSADSLFRGIAGVSDRLYTELIAPLLHVLPMCPGYDCSAAAALSCFHVFALQTRGAFDVRWCRGSISEYIFNPWVEQLSSRGVSIQGGTTVTTIEQTPTGQFEVSILQQGQSTERTIVCDAVVLAVGITAAKKLSSCPPLAALAETKGWTKLRGVTCVCVRLFFRELPISIQSAMVDSPVAVCGPRIGNLPELTETGFCIYNLQRLQDEFRDSSVQALEVDFFRADTILQRYGMDDDAIARFTLHAVSCAFQLDEPIDPTSLVDVSVVRARNAVSHFTVGSASLTPQVKLRHGLYICGDWIDRAGHSSWSTEKSVVTGRQAAAQVAVDFQLPLPVTATTVLAAAPDTPQLAAVRKFTQLLQSLPNGQGRGLPRLPRSLMSRNN